MRAHSGEVVFPLVPVTATTGRPPSALQLYSISLHTGTPDSSVSTMGRTSGEAGAGDHEVDPVQQPGVPGTGDDAGSMPMILPGSTGDSS